LSDFIVVNRIDGTDVLGEIAIYSFDEQGRFTRKLSVKAWTGSSPICVAWWLPPPRYERWNFALEPDASENRWLMKLTFKKFPPALRR
jgi:hypothetical protein